MVLQIYTFRDLGFLSLGLQAFMALGSYRAFDL